MLHPANDKKSNYSHNDLNRQQRSKSAQISAITNTAIRADEGRRRSNNCPSTAKSKVQQKRFSSSLAGFGQPLATSTPLAVTSDSSFDSLMSSPCACFDVDFPLDYYYCYEFANGLTLKSDANDDKCGEEQLSVMYSCSSELPFMDTAVVSAKNDSGSSIMSLMSMTDSEPVHWTSTSLDYYMSESSLSNPHHSSALASKRSRGKKRKTSKRSFSIVKFFSKLFSHKYPPHSIRV